MMLEVMQFYVSGFWVWLGLTIGLYLIMVTIIGFGAGFAGGLSFLKRSNSKESSDG